MSSRESEARPVTDGAAAPFPWLLAAAAVALGATALITTLWLMPRMGEEELGRLHLPRSWSDVQALRNVLDSYAQAHLAATLACFLMIYILCVASMLPRSLGADCAAGCRASAFPAAPFSTSSVAPSSASLPPLRFARWYYSTLSSPHWHSHGKATFRTRR